MRQPADRYGGERDETGRGQLAAARLARPSVLGVGIAYGLPLQVPDRLGVHHRQAAQRDPSGSRGRRRSLPCRNPRCSLIGPPDREHVCSFHVGTSLLAACPSGPGFFMNVHKIDAKRKYPIASTCHAGVDDATEGELEHHIPNSETALGRFHEVETAQTGLRQRMIVGEFADRHQRATLWPPSTNARLPERVYAVTCS